MDKRFPLEDQIEMLASALRGRVVTPGSPDYDGLRIVALANFDKTPAAVIRVATAADIAAVINFARATDLELAVRSGGHSVGGFSGSNGGLVIDLRDLTGIDIDHAGRTGWFGTGLNAGAVTAALEPHGLILPLGDSGTVGLGGITLGGGIGYLVRKHGLTIDSLLAAEIVTADGDILVADAEHHSDLFWALRGGGGNFGVVTRFRFRLHALPSFVGGPLILPATPEVLAGFVAAAEAAPDELTAIVNLMPAPPLPFIPPHVHGQLVLMGMMAHAGDAEAAARALAPFRALAPAIADLVGPAPLSSLYIPEDPNLRPAVTTRALYMDTVGLADARTLIEHLGRTDAPMFIGQVRVLGGAAARVPVGDTAYAHRRSRILVGLLAMYGGPTEPHERWASAGIAALRQHDAGAYVNFVSNEGPERLRAAYPGPTWDRLRQVKAKYDPENLFRLNQNIPPAA
ncbi:MAG: FAD-binding oxidoreductase [Devosia sp.]|uniref:FAD-binding oxidoreductase n=1 Tax=Devosia sp. TaxID=1871048 RepID=UPI001AD295F9|nr:FAD-binding oxidoreductase [Devosia sp.]MBN9316659.1 FAD-binding oxidoreductase [Devosia sp.]